jgi:hypothetical protein
MNRTQPEYSKFLLPPGMVMLLVGLWESQAVTGRLW